MYQLERRYHYIFEKYISKFGYTNESVRDTFQELASIDNNNPNEINEFAIFIVEYKLINLDDFKIMIACGVEPTYNNGAILKSIIKTNYKSNLSDYLLKNYHFDIELLRLSTEKHINNMTLNTFKIIYDSPYLFTDNVIDIFLRNDPNKLILDYLIEMNVNANQIIKAMCDGSISFGIVVEDIFQFIKNNVNDICYPLPILGNLVHSILSAKDIDLEDVLFLVELGADLKSNANELFMSACRYPNVDLIQYIIEECQCDINYDNSIGLVYAMETENDDIVELLLEYNIKISDRVISLAPWNMYYLEKLINYGVDPYRIVNVLLNSTEKAKLITPSLILMAKLGIDMNQAIILSGS